MEQLVGKDLRSSCDTTLRYMMKSSSILNDWYREISSAEHVENMQKLVKYMFNTVLERNNIVFMGIGKNVPMLTKVSDTLNSLMIPSLVMDAVDAMHGDAGFLRHGDTLICVSKSGTTHELINTVSYIYKALPVNIAGISMQQSKEFKPESFDNCTHLHLKLPLIEELDSVSKVPTMSPIAFQIYLDVVAMVLSNRFGTTIKDFLHMHPLGDIGNKLSQFNNDELHNLIAP